MYASKGYGTAIISKPIQYSGDIYYVEVTLKDGRAVLPISEGQQQCEILIAFVMPDYGSGWDSSNDFSAQALGKTAIGTDGSTVGVMSPYVPVYIDGKLYYGEEPDGTKADGLGSTGSRTPIVATIPAVTPVTKPSTTTPVTTQAATTEAVTTPPATVPAVTTPAINEPEQPTDAPVTPSSGDVPNKVEDNIVYGDATCNGEVDLSDALLILQYVANSKKYPITDEGIKNADVFNRGDGITAMDALSIQKLDSKQITSLPESVMQ